MLDTIVLVRSLKLIKISVDRRPFIDAAQTIQVPKLLVVSSLE